MSNLVLAIILLVASVFLVISVLLQQGKNSRLSGSIAGSNTDTYYGKNKGNTRDKIFSRITTIVAVLFVLVVLVVYAVQTEDNKSSTDTGVGDEYDYVLENSESTDATDASTDATEAATDATQDAADSTEASTEA